MPAATHPPKLDQAKPSRASFFFGNAMTLQPLVTSGAPTANRNNYAGSLGFRIIPARDLEVTHVGRPNDLVGGMAQSHGVRIWRASDSFLMAAATITSGSEYVGEYYREAVTPVTLLSGIEYRIASTEFASGDSWADSSTIGSHDATMASIPGRAWMPGVDVFPAAITSVANEGYVHPNLYETSGNPLLSITRHFVQ
jgi:hypothetical protein